MVEHDTIMVLDYGKSASQTGHLIARGIRRANVYSEFVTEEEMRKRLGNGNVKGIVLPGGPDSVYEEGAPRPSWVFDYGMPTLNVCYGHQFCAFHYGGEVRQHNREHGRTKLHILRNSRLLEGVPDGNGVWMNHGDSVVKLPDDFENYASTDRCPIAAFGSDKRKVYAVQFHPELYHTENGELILRNFAIGIAGCNPTWTMRNYRSEVVNKIRQQVGDKKAIVGLSGGVDSSVAAALGAEAIENNLIAVFVDHGGLRAGEAEDVRRAFEGHYKIEFHHIDAVDRFRRKLKGISDPEEKRKIVGNAFAAVFLEVAERENAECLFQGTIYPDIIETRGGIKTHHNLHPAIMEYFGRRGDLVEPLIELYKDEVRDLGLELGLPYDTVYRQPCPGPGLYVRIEGEITDDKLRMAQESDRILREEIDALPYEKRPWQYFTFVSESHATGQRGDGRAFGRVIIWRAVDSRDAMSADFWRPEWSFVEKISTRITNEVQGVTRAAYDTTQKPLGTIEFM